MRRRRHVAQRLPGHNGRAVAVRAEPVLARRQHVLHLVEAALDAAQDLPV